MTANPTFAYKLATVTTKARVNINIRGKKETYY
jgi:hypothetical protein